MHLQSGTLLWVLSEPLYIILHQTFAWSTFLYPFNIIQCTRHAHAYARACTHTHECVFTWFSQDTVLGFRGVWVKNTFYNSDSPYLKSETVTVNSHTSITSPNLLHCLSTCFQIAASYLRKYKQVLQCFLAFLCSHSVDFQMSRFGLVFLHNCDWFHACHFCSQPQSIAARHWRLLSLLGFMTQ